MLVNNIANAGAKVEKMRAVGFDRKPKKTAAIANGIYIMYFLLFSANTKRKNDTIPKSRESNSSLFFKLATTSV